VRLSEPTLRLVLDAAPTAIVVLDGASRIVFANARAERLFGYSRDELVGRDAAVLVPERRRQAREDGGGLFAPPPEGAAASGREAHGVRKDGREFPAEISVDRLESDLGPLTVATIVDVTERRRAEQRFRLAIESSPSGMVMVDRKGLIVLVNSQTEKLFGYRREELIGQPVELLVPERFRAEHPRERKNYVGRPEMRAMGQGRDLHGRRADGSEFPVEIGLNPIETEDGVFVLSAIVDITERKRLEGELHGRLEELDTAARRKDEFLAMLGHELRNPLAPMRNALQVMKMPAVDETTARQMREMLERQLHHLVRLVDDLLDVSRIINGRIELRRAAIDIAAAVERGAETAQPVLDARGHELVLSLPRGPLQVNGDLVRLSQVVANLLTNAAKYTPQADRIWLTVESDGPDVVLRVRDRGVGMTPELLPRVFDVFVQGDASLARSQGGLGLGLALVRRIVAMHGGSVTATSAGPGHGSEFVVRLPRLVQGGAMPSAGAACRPEPRVTDALRRRVLVVDDNVDAAESVAAILKLSGYAVRCAYDGTSALQLAQSYKPDVVVLDIGLPDITGYEVARQLRAQPQFEHLPMVAVTGYGQDADRRQSREAGIDEHLTKPVDPAALQAFIATSRH
jgi:PAS domain S-box-containing protein